MSVTKLKLYYIFGDWIYGVYAVSVCWMCKCSINCKEFVEIILKGSVLYKENGFANTALRQ